MWSVCWDSGEGQLGLTRGGPVSPNCHREHGQRGSVSTVINHTPSLSLPLYSFPRIFSFSLSHSFIYAVSFFLLSLTLLDSLSIPVFLPVFVLLCLFSPFFSFSLDVLFSTRSNNSPSSWVTFFVPLSSAHFHLPNVLFFQSSIL